MVPQVLMPFLIWLPLALSASVLVLGFCVFQSLKNESRALNKQFEANAKERNMELQRIQAELEAVKNGLREAEERAGLLVAPTAPRSGFNISKRSLALRMSRLGEKPENIATALSLPRREVDLLLKVHKIVITSADVDA